MFHKQYIYGSQLHHSHLVLPILQEENLNGIPFLLTFSIQVQVYTLLSTCTILGISFNPFQHTLSLIPEGCSTRSSLGRTSFLKSLSAQFVQMVVLDRIFIPQQALSFVGFIAQLH